MGDNTRLIVRLGFVATVIIGGILFIVGLQRAMTGIGQLRGNSLTLVERSISTNASANQPRNELNELSLGAETRGDLSLTTRWAQNVLCVSA